MNDTLNTTTETATETPEQTAQPTEVPPTEVPPTESSQRTAGWFSGGWRCGVAAAVIVVVAGAFFTIGWFTSTRGDHDHATSAKEINQRMNLGERGFERDGTGQRGPGQWQQQRQSEGQSESNGQPNQQVPSNPQAPSSQQGYLGVRVATVTPELQQQYGLSAATGVLVTSIDSTGPALQAGIRRGDIITGIDGTSVTSQEEVVSFVANKNAGDDVSVVVDRNGESLTFQVTLAARPATVS